MPLTRPKPQENTKKYYLSRLREIKALKMVLLFSYCALRQDLLVPNIIQSLLGTTHKCKKATNGRLQNFKP
ncbi:hypothetical protein DBZ36_02455 [Alginatibacterium sediminis]|uniref:Uncharacterized protein n=1 Tax=Alginatibacterium sediminis TaxID=2164068 RepID=A0A420ELK9_9ALTE|nr:hypothetical protein DBZ36_02455 [Alginatibacterium sediminis]